MFFVKVSLIKEKRKKTSIATWYNFIPPSSKPNRVTNCIDKKTYKTATNTAILLLIFFRRNI